MKKSIPLLDSFFQEQRDDATVSELLQSLSGSKVWLESPEGNNGDSVIELGCEAALQTYQIATTSSPEEANVILVRGGGSLVDYYTSGVKLLERLSQDFPQTPLVVLPQSVMLKEGKLERILRTRNAPAMIFAREKVSHANLKRMKLPDNFRIGLDHDMAFWLRGNKLLNKWKQAETAKQVLVVERRDAERISEAIGRPVPGGKLKKLLPVSVRSFIKRKLRSKSFRLDRPTTEFEKQLSAACFQDHPDLAKLPILSADISDRGTASFTEFCDHIAQSDAVLTNRLHVGVFAALLGKVTYLKTGSYYKIPSIYHYSMSDWEHVHLVEDNEASPEIVT